MDASAQGRVERLIAEAMERGEFEDLPGSGRPLPGAGTRDDDLWWVRNWVRRINQETSEDTMPGESES